MVREIVLYGNPVLREVAQDVPREQINTPEFQQFLNDMIETLHTSRNGVGLAAPQVGESIRVFVTDMGDEPHVFINPKLLRPAGEEVDSEACLSMPGLQGDVPRATRITIRALDRDGKEFRMKGEGFEARLFQHEYDHLDGILFIDRAIPGTQRLVSLEETEEGEEAQHA